MNALRRAAVVAAAVAAACLVWTLASWALADPIRVPEGPGSDIRHDLELGAVAGASAAVSLVGWLLLAVLERISRRAVAIWTGVAVVVLAVSMPYLPGYTAGERIALAIMHGALAAVLIVGLRSTSTSSRSITDTIHQATDRHHDVKSPIA